MTIKIATKYPSRSNVADADYPEGSFRDQTAPGLSTGTPVQEDWANDREGFSQGLLGAAGITANGNIDTVLANQQMDALQTIASPRTVPPAATQADVCSGLPDVQWHNPKVTPNYLTQAEIYRDSCVGIDPDTGRPVLYVVHDSTDVSPVSGCWDYSTPPTLGTALVLTFGLTAAGVCSVCSDGDYLYVTWGVSGGNVWVSKFNLNPFSSTPIWETDTGEVYGSFADDQIKIIVANTANLAIYLPRGSQPPSPQVGIINKSTGVLTLGHGNAQVGYRSLAQQSRLVSDGTSVYWVIYNFSGSDYIFYIASASIADPTTSAYTLDTVLTAADTDWWEYPQGLQWVNNVLVMSTAEGKVYLYKPSAAVVYHYFTLDGFDYRTTGPYDVMIGFDGLNVWFFLVDSYSSIGGCYTLVKIPASEFSQRSVKSGGAETIRPNFVRIEDDTTTASVPAGKILFDQRDIWLVKREGNIYRVCNPGMR